EEIWVVHGSESIVLHNLGTRKQRSVIRAGFDQRTRLPATSPDGVKLAYALIDDSGGGNIFVRNLETNRSTRILELPAGKLTDLTWNRDSNEILVGIESRSGLRLWFVSGDGSAMHPAPEIPSLAPGAGFTDDGKNLIVSTGDESEEVWVIENAASVAE